MAIDRKQICIVVPVYRDAPSSEEMISLLQCGKILATYDIVFAAPASMDISNYTSLLAQHSSISVKYFDQAFFSGLEGYNRLLLSHRFYQTFAAYKYILIHQLDVFVFKDDLLSWCNNGYDYVGAPWLDLPWHKELLEKIKFGLFLRKPLLQRKFLRLRQRLLPVNNSDACKVGNGGLSLRKVESFTRLSTKLQATITQWGYNEDVFWSMYVPLSNEPFEIPHWKKALSFAFDQNPRLAYTLSNQQLPLGAHAWYRHDPPYEDNLLFWEGIIKAALDKKQQQLLQK